MKVFAVNECDWWAAETAEEAFKAAMEEMGCETSEEFRVDGNAFDTPIEIEDADMLTMHIRTDDGHEGELISFRDQLNNLIACGARFPLLFASTEY